ncbi:MAG: hypothetical protein ACYSUF_07895, partial [Planctomycetota bacterium]
LADIDPAVDAIACAGIIVAALEDPDLPADTVDRLLGEAGSRVGSAFTLQDGFATTADGPPPPHGQALIAWALSRMLVTGRGDVDPALVRSAIDAAWASVPEPREISLLPWLGWAEADYAAATDRPMAGVDRLSRIRRLANASCVGSLDRPGPADLAGGLVMTGDSRLTATAQTLRPAAFLAWMVRQAELTPTPAEELAAVDRMLHTTRFVMQLSVREDSRWAYRNPGRSLGGIRAATWDRDQPVAAQALGLVFTAEALESLDVVTRRRAGSRDP